MKKRLKQIYNNISFPAQASDFTLKIFSSMASDKVYDITRLTGCSQNILENMQISASIVLQDNSKKKRKKKECQDLLSLHHQEVNSIYFLSALT